MHRDDSERELAESRKRRKCWAEHVGGCCTEISREHLISKSLLPKTTVLVEGFDWCRQPVSIGRDRLVSKVLCRTHNSLLEPADRAIASFVSIANEPLTDVVVSGRWLERWFIKTLVNISIGTNDHIGEGMAGSVRGWPPPYLAQVTFGSLSLTHRMGLYILNCEEPYKYRQGEILCIPLARDHRIGGALFGIGGVYLFLSLNPGAQVTNLAAMAPHASFSEHLRSASMTYRPDWVNFAHKDGSSARFSIDWSSL
jgi:hypothetical protein